MSVLLPPKCSCETIYRYYPCSCFFDLLVRLTLSSRDHVCLKKIKSVLRKEIPDKQFTSWNDRQGAAAVICNDCIDRFFWLGKYTKKYFDKNKQLYWSVTVKNRVKKFDVDGAKRYFIKNVDRIIPVILANKPYFH